MLKVDAITVLMGTLNILRGLSLEVDAGAIVGLVGRNGAGKTTTLRSIMGLVPLTQGDVTLDGRSLLRLPAHERAALGIGYLPEDRRLVGTLSVEENLRVPAEALKLGEPRERLETIYGYLPELKEIASRKAVQLSGGQQKLVALGRSFVHGRRALLLDEPFEGISTAFSRRLAQVIKDYQATEPKLSVLVAESDFKRVAMLTHRAYVIERGEVIEETSTVAGAG